jgi:hypothetical protein
MLPHLLPQGMAAPAGRLSSGANATRTATPFIYPAIAGREPTLKSGGSGRLSVIF